MTVKLAASNLTPGLIYQYSVILHIVMTILKWLVFSAHSDSHILLCFLWEVRIIELIEQSTFTPRCGNWNHICVCTYLQTHTHLLHAYNNVKPCSKLCISYNLWSRLMSNVYASVT